LTDVLKESEHVSKGSRLIFLTGFGLFLLYVFWEWGWRGDALTGLAVREVILGAGCILAACAIFLSWRHNREARYWLYYGIAMLCGTAGQIYETCELLMTGAPTNHFGPAESLWILQHLFFIAALFFQNRDRLAPAIPYLLDILLFLSVAVTVYWQLLVQPALGEDGLPELMMGYYLFTSSVNLVLLLGLLLLFTFERNQAARKVTLLLVLGFLANAVENSMALFMQGGGNCDWFDFEGFCSFLGSLLIGFSALMPLYEAQSSLDANTRYANWKQYMPLALGGLLLLVLHAASYPWSAVAFGSLLGVGLLILRLFAGIRHTESVNRALRETNLTYRNWADNALVGVFIQQKGRLVYVNGYCEELFGYEQGEMIGKTILQHIAFPEVSVFLAEAEKLQDNIPTTRFGITGIKWDQSVLYLEMHLATTFFKGKPAMSGTLIDITERKMSEQYLIRSEKLSVVGQLAAGVAHEIRNPLTALKGFTQLLHRTSHDNRKYYEIMLTELERINYIVGEFMVLSKPHNRQQFKEHDIHQILNSIIPILESQAILHNVMIRVESLSELPLVKCDDNQIKQVLINLMKNAIEAMPGGGVITVRYEKDVPKRELIVYIEDQGEGIPLELLDRLGEPFLTTKEKGTGLGLMVCFKIIQAHDGLMSVSSQPGQGTSVKITLPAR
jgi:two-component system sporulation sensor kinase A